MSSIEFSLHYRFGMGEWQEFLLIEDETLIGRGDDNNLVLKNREVSRHHARMRRTGDTYSLEDLESSNGTLVDGVLLQSQKPTPLKPGQEIQIGDFILVFTHVEDVDAATQFASEESPAILKYRYGEGPWQERAIDFGEILLGRDPACDVQLSDTEISREHARLRSLEGDFWLMDLGSTNGTQVGGITLQAEHEQELEPGQEFIIGRFVLVVETTSSIAVQRPASEREVERHLSPADGTMLDADLSLELSAPVRGMNLHTRDRVTIGRAVDNDVVLNHPLVSRYHAVVERMGTRFRILDLRSTNGVFVNEKRIEREAFLKDWDQIRIGGTAFVLAGQSLEQQEVPGIKLEAQHINQQVSSSLNLLQDINLTISPNEFIALVGMSGSGKTTLLNALSGYWPASHGSVMVNGIDLYNHYDLFRNDIGYVPQKDIVHAELTPEVALDYVAQLRMPPDTTKDERRKVVAEVLDDLDLTERRNVPIARLSGGQLKRVSIGCELLTKPRLFFLDEPTSGLDPGTEYDMMRLMRRLADQGRTVILITHATKNVMLCDKVIFLARGGNMAFFGAPEDALEYFDQFRTERERREKEMEFDDIYRILNDESRGAPPVWRERYLQSPIYYSAMGIEPVLAGIQQPIPEPPQASKVQSSAQRVSGFRQFMILSSRNLKILAQDKVSLTLMLALAPVIGLLDFIWGRNLYDPVDGDAGKIITLWFMGSLVTILVGALSSVREIVKEVDIYKRERVVNLKIMPYILSKMWVGLVLALYQSGVLLIMRMIFVNPNMPSILSFVMMYITFFLATMAGYLLGLFISAAAPNQNAAMMLIIVILVPQFMFAGALLPLDLIPGGRTISVFMPTRWAFEAFIRITELGEELTTDPCWTGFDKGDRLHLPNELKKECPCMGESIFTQCADFPGVLSPDFYEELAQDALGAPEPVEPIQPTAYPYPTAYPSPTPLPTPTLLPSLTPNPTPQNPVDMPTYMDQQREQGAEYQDQVAGQFEDYRLESIVQGEAYADLRTQQGDSFADLREKQGNQYADAMEVYGDERADWQESRDKAISSAEALIGSLYDNFEQAFRGAVVARWIYLLVIQAGVFVLIMVAQKRKDVV